MSAAASTAQRPLPRAQVLKLLHAAANENGDAAGEPATLPPRPDLLSHGLLAVHRLCIILAQASQHGAVIALLRRTVAFLALAALEAEGSYEADADTVAALTRVSAGLALASDVSPLPQLRVALLPPDLLVQLARGEMCVMQSGLFFTDRT